MLDYREEKGTLVVTNAQITDPVNALFGILKNQQSPDKLMTVLRGARGDPGLDFPIGYFLDERIPFFH